MTQPTFDETQHPRSGDGKFATKPAGESEVALADEDYRDTPPGHYTGKPFELNVQPQYWRDDHAVDAGPAEMFDIANRLHGMDEQERAELLGALDIGTSDLDKLYLEAAADGDVTDGYGPFYVSGDPDELREWCQDNPVWQQDGTTPHPTGGYVTVREHGDVTNYFDADGYPHREDGPATEVKDGSYAEWARHGELHREDGPSVRSVSQDSTGRRTNKEAWYSEGRRHREDGPALTEVDSEGRTVSEEYWQYDKLHREDGPAVIDHRIGSAQYSAGRSEYWVGGERVAVAKVQVQAQPGWKIENGRPVKDAENP